MGLCVINPLLYEFILQFWDRFFCHSQVCRNSKLDTSENSCSKILCKIGKTHNLVHHPSLQMGLFFIFFLQKLMDFIGECVHKERESVWEFDWFPKRPMHAEENLKPKTRKEKKKKSMEFLLGSTKYIARCLITKYLQQFCFSVGMECGWDTLWLLYLQIRDYKRSGKAGSATIKAGREEMKGATNRLTAMWLMIIRLDEGKKSINNFLCNPSPPQIKLHIWSYIGERERERERGRERQRNTHRQRDRQTDRSMNWLSPGDPIRELQEISSNP